MNSPHRSEQLLQRLLELSDTDNPELPEHPHEEAIAFYLAGELSISERTAMVEHLASCSTCRQLVSELLKCEEAAPLSLASPPASLGRGSWLASFQPSWAAAAIMLLAIGGVGYWITNPRLTEAQAFAQAQQRLQRQDFGGVRATVATVSRQGQLSDRLRNLDAQAARRMPHVIALASAGRLSNFGYQIGGVAARAAPTPDEASQLEQARGILIAAGSREIEVLLNRGHVLLSQGKDAEAAEEFAAAVKLKPEEPLAWLGMGLAAFLRNDLAGAEQAFRRCRELDPSNIAAMVNLAMTLEEQDQTADAVKLWQETLPSLAPTERAQVERHLRKLEEDPT